MKFSGPEYVEEIDHARLEKQVDRIKALMCDGQWRTHQEIADYIDAPHASVGSQLRNLRMKENGGYIVERQIRGAREEGLFEYRIFRPEKDRAYYLAEVDRRQKILVEYQARFRKAQEELDIAIQELDEFGQRELGMV